MATFYAMKIYWLTVLLISVFGVCQVWDEKNDPYRVVTVCVALAVMATTALGIWFAAAFMLAID